MENMKKSRIPRPAAKVPAVEPLKVCETLLLQSVDCNMMLLASSGALAAVPSYSPVLHQLLTCVTYSESS